MPTKSAPLGASLTINNNLINLNHDYFVYFCIELIIFCVMDLSGKFNFFVTLFQFMESQLVSVMKSVEPSLDCDDPDEKLLSDYNKLGFILASVRDLLNELKDYE